MPAITLPPADEDIGMNLLLGIQHSCGLCTHVNMEFRFIHLEGRNSHQEAWRATVLI